MESDIKVNCATHGETDAAFVCQHLVSGEKLGFNWAYAEEAPDAMCPDAWCDACESGLEAAGEWTEEMTNFADIKLVCTSCFGLIRDKNWIEDQAAYDELLVAGTTYLNEKQDIFRETFRIGEFERYDYDQGTGQLVFSNAGKSGVICEVAFVGSFALRNETWLWSWANSSNSELVKAKMREVRSYGEQHRYQRLAGAFWNASADSGWEMTGIAAYLLNAIGAYRCPDEKRHLYMVVLSASCTQ